jgi:hypothetical protein
MGWLFGDPDESTEPEPRPADVNQWLADQFGATVLRAREDDDD